MMSNGPNHALRRFLDGIGYRVRLVLLTVFGPATLDDEHDPIVQLKREHERGATRR